MKILIASDAHANIEPLKLMLENCKFDYSIFLGDIVDYGTRPSETVDVVRENFDSIVQGNHDNAAAFGVDCMCGQENHELSVYTREEITMKELSSNDVKFLQSLKLYDELEVDNVKISISHGSPRNTLYEYVYPWSINMEMFTSTLGQRLPPGIFLVGHTHYQFFSQLKGYTVINPGSIGQPRDNDPRPSYCLYDTDSGSVELNRISYDTSNLKKEITRAIPDTRMMELNLRLFRLL